MMFKSIVGVYRKEILDLLRDRKTLIFTIVMPILVMPVLIGGFGAFSAAMQHKEQVRTLHYIVVNAEQAPRIAQRLASREKLERGHLEQADDAGIRAAIQAQTLDFVVRVPEDFSATVQAGEQATLDIYLNAASSTSKVYERVRDILDPVIETLRNERLTALGVDETRQLAVLKPLTLNKINTADARENIGELIGGLLPYLLILVALSGASYPALDMGVGEKERGTLESLLLAPIPRTSIVLAKFLVIFTTSFVAVFLMVASMGVFFAIGLEFLASHGAKLGKLQQALGDISGLDLALVGIMLVPTAAIFGALLLRISFYARNFKEAQNYLQPLMIVTIIPIVMALLPGVKLTWLWAMVPLTNVSLAIKEIIKGTMNYPMVAVIFLSTVAIAGGLLWGTTRAFHRESVLFRT